MRELDIIAKIRDKQPKNDSSVLCGIGDDCAVTAPMGSKMLVSTDTLVENRHFNLAWHHPFELAAKAMATNLSDIAAMGGVPRYVSISLSFSDKLSEMWLDSFLDGIVFMQQLYSVNLIGGDTVRANEMSITITIIGEAEAPVLRSGARCGDLIYVAGPLGSAGGGLYLYENVFVQNGPLVNDGDLKNFLAENERYLPLLQHHVSPRPQIALGKALSESGLITAMQDLSDGLATDLAHIAKASGVQAQIVGDLIPIRPELQELCHEYGLSPQDLALRSGDDYLLVFTVPAEHAKKVEMIAKEEKTAIYQVGQIQEGEGVVLAEQDGTFIDISFEGYQHKSLLL